MRMTACILHSEDGTYSVEIQLSNEAYQCHIFHEDTAAVSFPDLPAGWPTPGNAPFHTLLLPCLHTFNASALALHFLHQDMRCPICRDGHPGPMGLQSLPTGSRETFARKLTAMRGDDGEFVLSAITLEPVDMEQHLKLQVHIGTTVVESQRLLRTQEELFEFNTYLVQRSFQRRLATMMRSQVQARVRVTLKHPLFTHPLQSNSIALHDVTPSTAFVLRTHLRGELKIVGRVVLSSPPHLELWTQGILEVCLQTVHAAITQQHTMEA